MEEKKLITDEDQIRDIESYLQTCFLKLEELHNRVNSGNVSVEELWECSHNIVYTMFWLTLRGGAVENSKQFATVNGKDYKASITYVNCD